VHRRPSRAYPLSVKSPQSAQDRGYAASREQAMTAIKAAWSASREGLKFIAYNYHCDPAGNSKRRIHPLLSRRSPLNPDLLKGKSSCDECNNQKDCLHEMILKSETYNFHRLDLTRQAEFIVTKYDEDGLRLAATMPRSTPAEAFGEARKIVDNKVEGPRK
jgi:hypothetical protein